MFSPLAEHMISDVGDLVVAGFGDRTLYITSLI